MPGHIELMAFDMTGLVDTETRVSPTSRPRPVAARAFGREIVLTLPTATNSRQKRQADSVTLRKGIITLSPLPM